MAVRRRNPVLITLYAVVEIGLDLRPRLSDYLGNRSTVVITLAGLST